jgi:predicted ribonuclease toxin of YeeF-YezG toxin-antitoxin module
MGIYGLVSANGLGEAMTGRDMFGNQLTDQQRQQSLMQALGILGVGGAAYGLDKLAAKNGSFVKGPYSNQFVQEKVTAAQQSLKVIGSRIGDMHVPVKVTVQEMRTNTGLGVKQVNVETKSVRDVVQMSGSGRMGGSEAGITQVKYGDQFTREGRRKVLKPNVQYSSKEGYIYKTDDKGRIVSCEGTLVLGDAKRNNHAQRIVGREDRLPDDDGGHLIASIFKGSGSLDNLVPMNGNLNKGEWKKLENMWSKALGKTPPESVSVKINPIYNGNSQRPIKFEIEYKIGESRWRIRRFDNVEGGRLTNGS